MPAALSTVGDKTKHCPATTVKNQDCIAAHDLVTTIPREQETHLQSCNTFDIGAGRATACGAIRLFLPGSMCDHLHLHTYSPPRPRSPVSPKEENATRGSKILRMQVTRSLTTHNRHTSSPASAPHCLSPHATMYPHATIRTNQLAVHPHSAWMGYTSTRLYAAMGNTCIASSYRLAI